MRARFVLINKTNVKDISEVKYPLLTLMQHYILFVKIEVKNIIKFYYKNSCIDYTN
jgi:ABC-type Fe3+/spermidine/putrescine transport system ATPase subunit